MLTTHDQNTPENKPLSGLLADALDQFSRLIRGEIALARAEFAEKSMAVARSSVLVGAGALLIMPSVGILLVALGSWMIEAGLRASVAYLISGVLGLALAGIIVWIGVNRLKAQNLVPNRTLGQIRQDVRTAKDHL